MAFERLEMRAASGKRGMPAAMSLSCHGGSSRPAAMSLSCHGGSSRPAAIVALSAVLVHEAGFDADSRFTILIGTDDDVGRLRILSETAGIIAARALKGGGLLLNLGYVPVIGTEPCKKKPTEARLVDIDIVEVLIPDFREGRPRLLPPPETARVSAAPAKPASKTGATSKLAETWHGVTIDFAEDAESVSFRGKSVEITARQAELLRVLARPRPQPVAESFLIKSCWGSAAPKNATELLRQMTADLRTGLAPLGLDLRTVKGIGYQLKDA